MGETVDVLVVGNIEPDFGVSLILIVQTKLVIGAPENGVEVCRHSSVLCVTTVKQIVMTRNQSAYSAALTLIP